MITVRFAAVFPIEDLDEDSVINYINDHYGKVFDVQTSYFGESDSEDQEPVRIIYVESSLVKFTMFKSDYHCLAAKENRHVLFPMTNEEEKKKCIAAGLGI